MMAASKGHADVVLLLLSAGANVEAADKVILIVHYCMAVSLFLSSNEFILCIFS